MCAKDSLRSPSSVLKSWENNFQGGGKLCDDEGWLGGGHVLMHRAFFGLLKAKIQCFFKFSVNEDCSKIQSEIFL